MLHQHELVPIVDKDAAHAMFLQWQARAAQQGVVLRKPPPEPTSCCGRGCNGCVWEGWFEAVAYWREEAALALSN